MVCLIIVINPFFLIFFVFAKTSVNISKSIKSYIFDFLILFESPLKSWLGAYLKILSGYFKLFMVCKATNLTQSPIFWGFYKIAEKLINLLNLVWVWLVCLFCCCAFCCFCCCVLVSALYFLLCWRLMF